MKDFILHIENDGFKTVPVKIFSDPNKLKPIIHPIRWKILKKLAESPKYSKELAIELGENEQTIYYHMSKLKDFIRLIKTEERKGAIAKYYTAEILAYALETKAPQKFSNLATFKHFLSLQEGHYLSPFLENGIFNAKIIIGSPDPHGAFRSQSRDGHFAIDLALFLGSFCFKTIPLTQKLDTEATEIDLKNFSLVLVGGPVTNTITYKLNKKIPIYFDLSRQNIIVSKLSGKEYYEDRVGIIIRMKNPYNKKKDVLILAGKRHWGTRAAVVAIIKYLDKLQRGNLYSPKHLANVVVGIDEDSDGIIDEVEFLE